jgi:hypothetical protein
VVLAGMTVTQVDPRPHFAAIQALLNAALSPNAAYAPDKVPGSEQNADAEERLLDLPDIYAELDVQPRFVPARGMTPRSSRGGWRVATLYVGATYNECLWAIAHGDAALRNTQITVADELVGPLIFESAQQPRWSKEALRWFARVSWSYST